MRALVFKEFRELVRDHRTLAMLIVLPILLLVIFGYAANFSVDRVPAIVVGPDAATLAQKIKTYEEDLSDIEIVEVREGNQDIEQMLVDQEAVMVINSLGDYHPDLALSEQMHAYIDGSSLFSAQAAKGALLHLLAEDAQTRIDDARATMDSVRADAEAMSSQIDQFQAEMESFIPQAAQALASGQPLPEKPTPPQGLDLDNLPTIEAPNLDSDSVMTVMFNPDLKTSWVMVPGLIGLILTFIGTLITSIGLVREREVGTLEQLAVMPLRPSAIIIGKITPYFLVAFFDMVLITLLGIWIFQVPFVGNIWLFGLASLIYLFVVLGLGVMISSISQTSGQSIQMAIMVMLPQILLSGLIFPLDSMAGGVRWIGYLLPLTWFNKVAQGIMLRGSSFDALWGPIAILAAMAVVIFSVATVRMRYSLTHGGARS